jgi:hypothetical protein
VAAAVGYEDPARALIRISRNHRLRCTDGNFCWKFRERYNGRPSVIAALPEKRSASRVRLRKYQTLNLSTKQRLLQRRAHLAREAEVENSLKCGRRGFDALSGGRDHLPLQLLVHEAR